MSKTKLDRQNIFVDQDFENPREGKLFSTTGTHSCTLKPTNLGRHSKQWLELQKEICFFKTLGFESKFNEIG